MSHPEDHLLPIREIQNAWIPLADGTRLAARVWLPEGADREPVPAILEYLPYRKDDGTAVADAVRHPYFAGRGYAAVRVDLRGTGDSDGLLRGEYLPQEQADALEVLAWLAGQPWCSGSVGMIGYSWGGFNGLQVAACRPPQLKAVITVASTDDRYLDDCHFMGGCLLGSDMLKWASSMLTYALQPPDRRFVAERRREMWLDRLENAPELAGDWTAHQSRDDFWKHGSVAEDYGAIQCPVMMVGGWADAYTNSVPRLLEHLAVPRLGIIGPWGHMMPYEGIPGPSIAFLEMAVRWWDQWLKGIETGIMDGPRLRVWMQEYATPATFHARRPGRWVAEDSWPPAQQDPRSYVLRADGTLSEGAAEQGLGPSDAGESPEIVFAGSQECGESAGVWCANGYPDEIAGDQSREDARSLCFTTAPLESPLDVLGYPLAKLRVSVDRPRALLAIRLEDVAPDGASLLVSWGMLNLTHRAGHESPEPLEQDRSYEVTVQSRVCGHRFPEGHRIRLALSPTYWPHAWPSPESVSATFAVDGPSLLELPAVRSTPFVWDEGTAGAPAGHAGLRQGFAARDDHLDRRTRQIHVDPETRHHEIVDHEEHSRVIPGTGARYTEEATDIYSIVEDEPLSATVCCTRETRSCDGDTAWRVTLASKMTCDEGFFHVREEYAAYEGETQVFAKARAHSIPRDLV